LSIADVSAGDPSLLKAVPDPRSLSLRAPTFSKLGTRLMPIDEDDILEAGSFDLLSLCPDNGSNLARKLSVKLLPVLLVVDPEVKHMTAYELSGESLDP
jgi:hypothetical protein